MINAGEARQDPNIVTGMFYLNGHYVYILFDTGVDKSFVSNKIIHLFPLTSTPLKTKYSIELANGKLIEANSVIQGCTLELAK